MRSVPSDWKGTLYATKPRRTRPDWRDFWAEVVASVTGCHAPALVDELYDYYAHAAAWSIAPGGSSA